ncbi:MAG TPA: thiosulfohydrolase SoxB, partial [Thermopetrobacter sp.]|nr:thiosulfohydrolase SoxB [Thermopetrobacter sp.]
MTNRREFLQIALAAMAMTGGTVGGLRRALAGQAITQESILDFKPKGQVTLIHVTDIHAQLMPVYFREPEVNIGVGEAQGKPPHLVGEDFLRHYGIKPGSPEAYALTYMDFAELARSYGRVGGMDRVATIVNAIRAERPGKCLFLDGGDTWQGSWTSLKTQGRDMVDVMNLLKTDAMTAHWEFTFGAERVEELIKSLKFPYLAGNVINTDWEEPVFKAWQMFERGGVKVAVIGQAFPYTPVANPRYKIPQWSFGIREKTVQKHVNDARAAGAELVVLLSHNGYDVDRKMARRVKGIDIILVGHTHDATPEVHKVGDTILVSSGCSGKFVSRLDVEVKDGRMSGFNYKLMPVFADVIKPDPGMAALIAKIRKPHEKEINEVLGRTDVTLYRRGNIDGTFDDLICAALMERRDAEIALSPGFRWGPSLPAGSDITADDVYSQTAITYPEAYRSEMTGKLIKEILEDVCDNLYNPDPYYQQGGDMVRSGGIAYDLYPYKPMGQRIQNLRLARTGEPLEAGRKYVVSGWASVNEGVEGPP